MSSQLEEFKSAVYYWVAQIPKGKVTSYGYIARLAGYPRHARHVSKALGSADKSLNLPWQRVIGSTGKIAFSADSNGYAQQVALLEQEGVTITNGKVNLKQFAWQFVENQVTNDNKAFNPESFFK